MDLDQFYRIQILGDGCSHEPFFVHRVHSLIFDTVPGSYWLPRGRRQRDRGEDGRYSRSIYIGRRG